MQVSVIHKAGLVHQGGPLWEPFGTHGKKTCLTHARGFGATGRRAGVLFDDLEVFGSSDKRLFSAGWVFSLINAVKPDLRGEGGEAQRCLMRLSLGG